MKRSKQNKYRRSEKGFTLVELSIVLLIIGLIVGGIFAGQDLVDSARLRATVAQLESYNTGVQTFKLRYNEYLPGDIVATTYGLTTDGNANGMIQDADGAVLKTDGEIRGFWNHLSQAGLIGGYYSDATSTATIGTTFPASKVGVGGVGVYGVSNINYYQIGVLSAANVTASYDNTLSPSQAFYIDNKLDDSNPFTGNITAVGTAGPPNGSVKVGATAAVRCVTETAIANFDTESRYEFGAGDTSQCQLRIRMPQ